jgi:protein TonB
LKTNRDQRINLATMKHHAALTCSLTLHLALLGLLALVPAGRPYPAPGVILAVRLDDPGPLPAPRTLRPVPAPARRASGPAARAADAPPAAATFLPPAVNPAPQRPEPEPGDKAPAREIVPGPPTPPPGRRPDPAPGVTPAIAPAGPAVSADVSARAGAGQAPGIRPPKEAPAAPAPAPVNLDDLRAGGSAPFFFALRNRILAGIGYPLAARRRGWQGAVMVEFRVNRDGRLEEARVIAGSGHELLDRTALEGVRRAAPFDLFPDEITAEKAVLTITRSEGVV